MSSQLSRSLVVAATLATGFMANGLVHRGVCGKRVVHGSDPVDQQIRRGRAIAVSWPQASNRVNSSKRQKKGG
jgi:hypothetical protein